MDSTSQIHFKQCGHAVQVSVWLSTRRVPLRVSYFDPPVGHVIMNCRYDTVYLLRDMEVFPFLHPHCTELEVREMEAMHKLARQSIQAKVGGFGGVISRSSRIG